MDPKILTTHPISLLSITVGEGYYKKVQVL